MGRARKLAEESKRVPLPGEQVFCLSRQYARCSVANGKLFMVLCYGLEAAIMGKIALPSEMKHVKSQLILLASRAIGRRIWVALRIKSVHL